MELFDLSFSPLRNGLVRAGLAASVAMAWACMLHSSALTADCMGRVEHAARAQSTCMLGSGGSVVGRLGGKHST